MNSDGGCSSWMDTMTDLKKRLGKAATGALLTISVTVGVLLASTAGNAAVSANVARNANHFIECFGWMLTDPDLHRDHCSPGHKPVDDPVSDINGGTTLYPTVTETYTDTYTDTYTNTVTVTERQD